MRELARLAAVAVLAVGVGAVGVSALRRVQRQLHVERTMLLLQRSLERYRTAHGSYVRGSPRTAVELVEVLLAAGILREPPLNPYAGRKYGADPFEIDRIWYTTDAAGTRYELEALRPDGDGTLLVLRAPR